MSHHYHWERRLTRHGPIQKPTKDRILRFELHGNPTRPPTIHKGILLPWGSDPDQLDSPERAFLLRITRTFNRAWIFQSTLSTGSDRTPAATTGGHACTIVPCGGWLRKTGPIPSGLVTASPLWRVPGTGNPVPSPPCAP
jgi:hypothetical protein